MKNHLTDNLIAQLNGIYHLSAMGNESGARNQIKTLAETLRYKIRNRNEMVPLQQEFGVVRGFFSLFTARWGDEFKNSLEAQEEILDEYLPHYSIMSLVENSLFHAFEKHEGQRIVKVSAARCENGLTVWVEDNGCGFRPSGEEAGGDEYGSLNSLKARLQALYGGEARLSFSPAPGSGTKAELFFPESGST